MHICRLWFSVLAMLLGSASVSIPALAYTSVESANPSGELQEAPSQLETKEAKLSNLISHGIADAKAGQFSKAIDEYKEALTIDPHCAPASINLGLAYFKSSNFQDAIPPLENALRDGTDSDQVHTLLGMSFYSLHRYKEAGSEFEVLFKREPSNTTLQYFLAESYMSSHQ